MKRESEIPPETTARLHALLDLLKDWNAKINLVGRADQALWWNRHVLDSLQLVPLIPPGEGPIVDLGSGAGFPGLVLALATRRPTHLIEADQRKAAFLIEASRILGLHSVTVHRCRIQAASPPPAAVVTARALAPLSELLRHACRLLAPGGVGLFPKGQSAEDELTSAAAGWTMRVERLPSRTDPKSRILRISEIRPAGVEA